MQTVDEKNVNTAYDRWRSGEEMLRSRDNRVRCPLYGGPLRSRALSLTQSKLCLRCYLECACARYSPEQALLAVIPICFIHAFTHSRIHRGVNDVNDVNDVNVLKFVKKYFDD